MDEFEKMIGESGIDGMSNLMHESVSHMVSLVATVYRSALEEGLPEDFAREVAVTILLEGMRQAGGE